MRGERRAARLVFPGFKFGKQDPREALALARLGAGGFCLYGGRPAEVAAFTARLSKAAPQPLLFCADYEDGVATQCPGATALPANMGLGAAGSESLARRKGVVTGREARALGVRWVLAPVCDLATKPENPIVNVRSFSADPAVVTRLARAFLRGLRSEGVMGCLKHFPGHGETTRDSHLELPRVGVGREMLARREMAPFRALASSAGAVMTGHLSVPALVGEDRLPYSLSSDVARTLRRGLGFKGLVSTDALDMRAVSGRFKPLDSARRALLGGTDILLVPEDPRGLISLLQEAVAGDAALAAAADAAHARLERALAALPERPAPAGLEVVGCAAHQREAADLAEACLAWKGGAKPLKPGAPVRYWEPEAEGPAGELGGAFLAELAAGGVAVTRTRAPGPGPLVAAVFLGPRAYTGRISFGPAGARRVRAALAKAGEALVVSFGSPFVFDELGARGLCAFSRNAPAQRAAARALLGRHKA